MPVTREEKEQQIAELSERFAGSEVIVWADYRGLTMPRLTDLRKALRPHKAEFHVVKNTLAELALRRAGLPVTEQMLVGTTAAGVLSGDIAAAARALNEFAVANRELVVRGGQAKQRLLSAEEVSALSFLPPREVLLGQVLGGIKSPVTGLVTVLNGTVRSLLNVLQARARQLEEAGA